MRARSERGTFVGEDLTGKRFGWLTVKSRTGLRKGGNVVWLCQCACGKEKAISAGDLLSGGTKSCGCKKRIENSKKTHWHPSRNYRHQPDHWNAIERLEDLESL